MEEIVKKVEAVLFLTPRPLSPEEMADVVGEPTEAVERAIGSLKERYRDSALLVEEFFGKYRLNVRQEYRWVAKRLGLLPEFSQGELSIIAELIRRGELRLSEVKKRNKNWKSFIERLRAYGFIVTKRSGRSIIVKKTKLLERYFGVTRRT